MKTKLTLIAIAALGSASLFAGPGGGEPRKDAAPQRLAPVAELIQCETMTVQTGGKDAGLRVVACKDFAKIRPSDCRIACAKK